MNLFDLEVIEDLSEEERLKQEELGVVLRHRISTNWPVKDYE